MAQPLPDGHVLLVGARSRSRLRGTDHNAVVVNADGDVVRTAPVGDAVEHVLTTPTGNVWIGYFDEGIFGGTLAKYGIVRFTNDLEVNWTYPTDTEFGPVDDCSALSLVGETAWACYYAGFPIVKISDGLVSGWTNAAAGARALIVEDDVVALVGGPQRDHIVRGMLSGTDFESRTTHRLTLSDRELPRTASLVARGNELHAFVERAWFKLGLGDIPL